MRPPDKHGTVGWSAWALDVDRVARADGRPHATLCGWLVHCPGAHVAWDQWLVTLIHLRPVEGVPAAFKQYPGAELELLILTIDPRRGEPNLDNWKEVAFLEPADVCEQFHGITDAQAIHTVERLIDWVVAGQLSPDSDYRAVWHAAIWSSVEHLTTGHPVGHA